MEKTKNLDRINELSEKTGIEMCVIYEAEKITMTNALRFVRLFKHSIYINDPLDSSIRQDFPNRKTIELPGISFLVDNTKAEETVENLNSRFSYRHCIAFISDKNSSDDEMQTISMIKSGDKYNTLRFQETSGGINEFSTDKLIEKLKIFEKNYPFIFLGVGDDWLLIRLNERITDWVDLAKKVLEVCPTDDVSAQDFAKALQDENGTIFMWWD